MQLGTRNGRYALSVLQSHSPAGGSILRVNSGEIFPSNYIGEIIGPYHVSDGSQVTIENCAVVSIVDGATALPTQLRSYASTAAACASS